MQIDTCEVEATISRYKESAQPNLFKKSKKNKKLEIINMKTIYIPQSLIEWMNKRYFLPIFKMRVKGYWTVY